VNLGMHSEAVIKRVWRCACRYDYPRLEEYMEVVDLEMPRVLRLNTSAI